MVESGQQKNYVARSYGVAERKVRVLFTSADDSVGTSTDEPATAPVSTRLGDFVKVAEGALILPSMVSRNKENG